MKTANPVSDFLEGFKGAGKFYCPQCNQTHHIFNFGPSSKHKVAACGQVFTVDGVALLRGGDDYAAKVSPASADGKEV